MKPIQSFAPFSTRQYSLLAKYTRNTAHRLGILPRRIFAWILAACFLQTLALAGVESDNKQPVPMLAQQLDKPAWLSDCSVSLREGYDSNVFLDGVSQQYLKKDLQSTKNLSSWVTTIAPRIGFDIAPLFPDQDTIKKLSLTYAPEIGIYHNLPSESYTAHRIIADVKGSLENITFSLENTFSYVRGDKDAPAYPGGYLNAFAQAPPRERRDQFQDHMKFSIQYDQEKFFLLKIFPSSRRLISLL